MHAINASQHAPITGLSLGYVYSVLYFAGGGIAFLTLLRLWRAFTGQLSTLELNEFAGDYSGDPSHNVKSHLE
jgi:TRAP-type C4-dicarboxylate transport system permease small subunit